MQSKAAATWQGSLVEGSGSVTLGGGSAGPLPVSWKARTEEQGANTNPEELLAAAHSACYSMALSHALAGEGHPPTQVDTDAVVTFGPKDGGGFEIKAVALTVRATVPGMDADAFIAAAEGAKVGCPVSQALGDHIEVSLDAALH